MKIDEFFSYIISSYSVAVVILTFLVVFSVLKYKKVSKELDKLSKKAGK